MNATEANVKATLFGDVWVLMGDRQEEVQAALNKAVVSGMQATSSVQPAGRKWTATYKTPEQAASVCTLVRIGRQTMVKGATFGAVQGGVDKLVSAGAILISAPSESTGGGWVAVCEDSGVYKFH